MENSNKDKECRKFPQICKFISMLYPELQLYNKTIKQTEEQKGREMEQRTSTDI